MLGYLTTKTTCARRHAVGVLVPPCNGSSSIDAASRDRDASTLTGAGFAARFANFDLAEEAKGDLDRVVWPDYMVDAGLDISDRGAFQFTDGDLMRSMPCFCGCRSHSEHHSNRDRSTREVHEDRSVTFGPMAPVCGVCLQATSTVMEMLNNGVAPRAMSAAMVPGTPMRLTW